MGCWPSHLPTHGRKPAPYSCPALCWQPILFRPLTICPGSLRLQSSVVSPDHAANTEYKFSSWRPCPLRARDIEHSGGPKIGLVGRNGTGKTTLLRLIQGDITPDNGSIEMSPRTIIGTVAQEAPAGRASLLDTVLAADTERESLLRESETAKDPARIADIHTRLADMDAHAAPCAPLLFYQGWVLTRTRNTVPAATIRVVGGCASPWQQLFLCGRHCFFWTNPQTIST